jgi:hypothetical protein
MFYIFINEYGNRNDPRSGPDISTAAIWRRIRKNTWKKSSDLSGGLYEQKDMGSLRADL